MILNPDMEFSGALRSTVVSERRFPVSSTFKSDRGEDLRFVGTAGLHGIYWKARPSTKLRGLGGLRVP